MSDIEAVIERVRASVGAFGNAYAYVLMSDRDALLAHIDAQAARIAALEGALAPFAAMAEHYDHYAGDQIIISASPARKKWVHLTAGDLRRARALLTPEKNRAD